MSPGFDIITAEVVGCLPKRPIVHLTHIQRNNKAVIFSYFMEILGHHNDPKTK